MQTQVVHIIPNNKPPVDKSYKESLEGAIHSSLNQKKYVQGIFDRFNSLGLVTVKLLWVEAGEPIPDKEHTVNLNKSTNKTLPKWPWAFIGKRGSVRFKLADTSNQDLLNRFNHMHKFIARNAYSFITKRGITDYGFKVIPDFRLRVVTVERVEKSCSRSGGLKDIEIIKLWPGESIPEALKIKQSKTIQSRWPWRDIGPFGYVVFKISDNLELSSAITKLKSSIHGFIRYHNILEYEFSIVSVNNVDRTIRVERIENIEIDD